MARSKAGETERAIASRLAEAVLSHGADTINWISFPCGGSASQTHGHPTERVVEASEIIRFDISGTYGAWSSDFARTYSSGFPTQNQRDTYSKLVEIQEATIEIIKPGITAEEIFQFCKKKTLELNLPFHLPHIGHSFGIEIHESPILRPGDQTEIRPGMVLNVEPLTSDASGAMYHVEDLLEVTETGTRILTNGISPAELPTIGQ
jgi:Xaa-Pro aminopeptidase